MRPLLVLVATGLAALVLAGCGSDQAAEPASLVPASAYLYGQVDVRPEGEQQEAIDALLAKFPGKGSAGQRIEDVLERAFREGDTRLSYEQDVEPWLGEQIAFFATPTPTRGADADGGADATLMLETDDEDATRKALDKAAGGRSSEASYEGVDYSRTRDRAGGVVDGWLVVGSEAGFKQAVDVSQDGQPLEDVEAFKQAIDAAPDDRLGLVYNNLARSLSAAGPAEQRLLAPFRRAFRTPLVTTIGVEADGVRFDSTLPEDAAGVLAPLLGRGSELVAQLPAGSWLALGQPDLGRTLSRYVDLFADAVGGRAILSAQLRQATGLDLDRDLLDWMGDFGLFVRGTSAATLSGALVVETDDEAATRRALGVLRRLAERQGGTRVLDLAAPGGGSGFTLRDSDAPRPLHVFTRSGRFVVAYGDDAAREALDPSRTLSDDPDFERAARGLGEGFEVSSYLDVPPILDLAESEGAASEPDWPELKRWLEPLGALVSGAQEQDGQLEARARLSVP